jgi:hypothetical protein
VEHDRTLDVVGEVEQVVDTQAVVRHDRVRTATVDPARRREQVGERTAEAKSKPASSARVLAHGQQVRERRGDVRARAHAIEPARHGHGVGQAGFVLAFEAGLQPPEHIGCERDKARCGQTFRYTTQVVVDPKISWKTNIPGPRPESGTAQNASKKPPSCASTRSYRVQIVIVNPKKDGTTVSYL